MTQPSEPAAIAVYQVVAARRTQWDMLLWQVPVLSLTAQAFLFTIELSQGNDAWARIISALLSLNVSIVSIMLMARHRQAELHDAHWLERFERDALKLGTWGAHGTMFRAARDTEGLDAGLIGRLIPLRPMFGVWVIGLALFGVGALVVIVRTLLTL